MSTTKSLPSRRVLLRAFLERDRSWDGVFFTAVRTTRVFCRPGCPARAPRPENVEFFATSGEAEAAGYRACRRCRPLASRDEAPAWLRPLVEEVERSPGRWTDDDLRARGVNPERVRRWFLAHRGTTFHAWARARRLGAALDDVRRDQPVTTVAFDHGWESLSGFHAAFRKLAGRAPRATRDAPLVRVSRIATPLGDLVAGATDGALVLLEFADRRMLATQLARLARLTGCVYAPGTNEVLELARRELDAYFAGESARFTVALELPGTEFQRAVWAELRRIEPGATISYARLASAIGRPSAVRAVARANGDNRLAIVVPCHRVVGSDGELTGYGGGLWRKKRLLELERDSRK
jgi:AraC family transcriptional regulator of adaptative response/methylated-DNA-[protein]-cysteine methyltransferase